MGKGNFTFRDLDGNRIKTFYFDRNTDFEGTKRIEVEDARDELAIELRGLGFAMRRRRVEQMMMDRRLPVEITDQRVYDIMSDADDDEISNLAYEAANVPGFSVVKPRRYDENLASGYRDSAVVIAESDRAMLCVGDNEGNVAITVVPTAIKSSIEEDVDHEFGTAQPKCEILREEIGDELSLKLSRRVMESDIQARYDEIVKAETEKRYAAEMEKYREEANAVMRKVHEYFGEQGIRQWSSAWTSSKLMTPEEIDEQKLKYY